MCKVLLQIEKLSPIIPLHLNTSYYSKPSDENKGEYEKISPDENNSTVIYIEKVGSPQIQKDMSQPIFICVLKILRNKS